MRRGPAEAVLHAYGCRFIWVGCDTSNISESGIIKLTDSLVLPTRSTVDVIYWETKISPNRL